MSHFGKFCLIALAIIALVGWWMFRHETIKYADQTVACIARGGHMHMYYKNGLCLTPDGRILEL